MGDFHDVYILVSELDPRRHYTGITADLTVRLRTHHAGRGAHTSQGRPWRIETVVAFRSREKAEAFERYLKTHSGRAFATKHFWCCRGAHHRGMATREVHREAHAMTSFFRFPHTPHLAWLGKGQPRDDKLLSPDEAEALLSGEVVVEEKVDGANIGFSTGADGELRVQNRGNHLDPGHAHPQFRPLWAWLRARESALVDALGPDRMLFGEWCYAVHSVAYERLPDWFLGFDVYDRPAGRFWDSARRDALLSSLRLYPAPRMARGHFTIEAIERLLTSQSQVGGSTIEGLVVRRESGGFTTARAKLVRPEFTQAIDEHWSRGPLRRNALAEGATPWP